jgi:pimeloyl-ACP methyl ester carboxylesterase
MGRRWPGWLAPLALGVFLGGCAGLPDPGVSLVRSGEFDLAQQSLSGPAVRGGSSTAARWLVVIEGDGPVWPAADRAPADPTPRASTALALARGLQRLGGEDTTVFYLGRPCQYGARHRGEACAPRWWTTDRFAEPVIAAYEAWLDRLPQHGRRSLCLVGVSGGGLIALLLAERRPEVTGVMTVASPVAVDAWTDHHQLTVLGVGTAVARGVERLGANRQLHFLGGRDSIVPLNAVLADTQRLVGAAQVKVLPEARHAGPWDRPPRVAGEIGPMSTPISAWCADGSE